MPHLRVKSWWYVLRAVAGAVFLLLVLFSGAGAAGAGAGAVCARNQAEVVWRWDGVHTQAWIFFAFVVSVVWIIILANEVGECWVSCVCVCAVAVACFVCWLFVCVLLFSTSPVHMPASSVLSCGTCVSLPPVGLLLALGLFLGVSNTILGLTVLAWGNSLGDLVADVTVAKEGLPAMAIAGCFAGPMFNMLVGLGLSTTIATLREGSISLGNDSSTVNLSFAMLLLSLVSSMIVVPMSGFRFKRPYGIVLILVYFVFLAVTILLQTGAVKFHFFGPDGGAS